MDNKAIQLYQTLPKLPRPRGGDIPKWIQSCRDAGYPDCQNCGAVIQYKHWVDSTTLCHECYNRSRYKDPSYLTRLERVKVDMALEILAGEVPQLGGSQDPPTLV